MNIDEVTFYAGSTKNAGPLVITPKRMTIFIGPNNGGKSRALAEIQQSLIPVTNFVSMVVRSAIRSRIEEAELNFKIEKVIRPKRPGDDPSPSTIAVENRGSRTILNMDYLKNIINQDDDSTKQYIGHIIRHFFLNLQGAGRLDLANAVTAEPVGTHPNSTIARIYADDHLRSLISSIVFRGFGQYLVVDPTQLPHIGYKLSSAPAEHNVEKRLDNEAAEFFKIALSLSDSSDGTRAFVGLLTEVIAGDLDIIFIDEPEAFLHPGLQHLLGQQIASNAIGDKQVFAATHSPSFLLGCVLSGVDVDIVRLTHKAGSASARHLEAARLKSIMTDPLFRSVNAASALFYESAVVVEGDSDRAFYDEINSRMSRFSGDGLQHAVFLNARNKQTVVNIVQPLRDIGIPAAFILDIDWIKEDGQVWDRYFAAIGAPSGLKEGFAATRRSVRASLEAADGDYKRHGGLDLLSGSDFQAATQFFDQMELYGLFTVRSGELESWLRPLGADTSKNKWLTSVFSKMGSDPDGSEYIRPGDDDVWTLMRRISHWTEDSNRRGMGE